MADSRFFPRGKLEDTKATLGERVLARLLPREDIPSRFNADSLYLRRFPLLSVLGRKAMLHCFYRSDEDPEPHNHPWQYFTLCLWGGYDDEEWIVGPRTYMPIVTKIMKLGRWIRRPASHIHRVRLHNPKKRTWTLVITGKKTQEWGFYTPTGFVHWTKYLSR